MYHFVFETPNPPTAESSEDRRRAELQDSEARSHAAKIAYLKKIAKKHISQPTSRLDQTDPNVTKQDEEEGEVVESQFINRRSSVKSDESGREERFLGGRPPPKSQSARRKSQPTLKGNRIYSRAKFKLEPRSLLAQTTKDPFDSFPERRLPENVEKVVQYAFDRIWPEMLCAVRGETLALAKSEWKGHGLQDELLFHVQVALACGLNLALQNIPKISEALALARLSHYSRAIRLLKQRIESLDGPASEDLMMSMLILGVNADVEEAMPEAHPQSPLATSQYMHLYGRLTLMPSYATALHQLVEDRGGIFKLRHLALADWLLLADLHHASRTGDRLRYPPLRAYHSIAATGKHVPDATAKLLTYKLGSGFIDLEKPLLSAEMRAAIAQGVEATVALDHYDRYENEQPRLVDVMLAANEAQRSFLEIDPKRGVEMVDFVHETCRLTALIFSDMVLFPMPSCTRIKPRLAGELRRVFAAFGKRKMVMEDVNRSTSISDMLIWVLVVGGIAASFTEDRPWFETQLQMRLREADKLSPQNERALWAGLKSSLARFLWWDPVMDSPALDLWKAAIDPCKEVSDKKNVQGT